MANRELNDTINVLLADKALPAVIADVADAFEACGIHVTLAAVRVGDPVPTVVNRIRQEDVAGAAFAGLGNRLGSWLMMQAKPKARKGRS